MNSSTHDELVQLVIGWLKENNQSTSPSNAIIDADTDLMAAGLLDSFGFVDLVLFLEGEYGTKINLADVDPADFTVVKGLCKIVLASSNGNHAVKYT